MKKTIIPIIIFSGIYIHTFPPFSSGNNIFPSIQCADAQNLSGTRIIHQEFETIRRVLFLLEKAANYLDKDQPISQEAFNEILEIIRNFSDKCHQEKEDKILFPLLKDKVDRKKKDFLGRLLMEHVTSRDKIRDLSESLNNIYQGKKAKKRITKIAYAYIKHTKKHIQTEEKILLPWANKILTDDDQIMIKNKFEDLERNDIETGVHEKYITKIEELEKQLKIYPEF